ncbi:hypothetical protein RRG08_046073 [Elysia crispata]|uniref:Receptor ligand binding region domain-containing protein n=1 Tax=Elysia crispata TaxID=231223 RepID=A0AAE0Y539_9GAST|nr:hypothetical protein RRG08_046073 [Elysia crispata]
MNDTMTHYQRIEETGRKDKDKIDETKREFAPSSLVSCSAINDFRRDDSNPSHALYQPQTGGHSEAIKLTRASADLRMRTSKLIVLCASPNTVREIMIKAHELNFDNGEYVFFNIDLFASTNRVPGGSGVDILSALSVLTVQTIVNTCRRHSGEGVTRSTHAFV